MRLSNNSWHAKLNTFVYGYRYLDSVDCLCPYFWGTLLAILCVPVWLIGHGIARLLDVIDESGISLPRLNISYDTQRKIGLGVAYGLLFGAVVGITFGILNAITEYGLINVLILIGLIALAVVGLIGLALLLINLAERYNDWRYDHPREKKPNLLMEFVKAKKNKHCPLVEWTE